MEQKKKCQQLEFLKTHRKSDLKLNCILYFGKFHHSILLSHSYNLKSVISVQNECKMKSIVEGKCYAFSSPMIVLVDVEEGRGERKEREENKRKHCEIRNINSNGEKELKLLYIEKFVNIIRFSLKCK